MTNTAIAIKPANTLAELQNLGTIFVASGFFSDTQKAAQAIVKVMAGAELGFPPIASMTGVYIVKGKVSLAANLMASAIKRSGKYNYRVLKLTDQECEIQFFENGESIGISSLTMAQAKAANLHQDWDRNSNNWKDKSTWKNFPRNMLFARAMSNGAKWYTPDIFGGPVYTPEELGAPTDEEGNVIDIQAEETISGVVESVSVTEHEHDDRPTIENRPEAKTTRKTSGGGSKNQLKVLGNITKQLEANGLTEAELRAELEITEAWDKIPSDIMADVIAKASNILNRTLDAKKNGATTDPQPGQYERKPHEDDDIPF